MLFSSPRTSGAISRGDFVYRISVFTLIVQATPPPKRYETGSPSTLGTPRKITDPAHPACGQMGLFAAKKIPAGATIVS
jgi:hypothetical protein